MITRDQIPAVLDHPVYDVEGNKIGDAKHVFLDDRTGDPEWVSVKTGLFGSSESFVPIREASLAQDHLEVPYPKDKVKDAPQVDVEGGGHLSEQEEHRLYDYYGVRWDTAWEEANEPGAGGWAHEDAASDTTAVGGMAAGGMAAGGTAAGGTAATGAAAAGTTAGGTAADGSMIRSEERMHVGTERREAGRARLRKYVVTEEEQQTVPLRHEKVRLVREPITEAERGEAMAGAEISEAEQEVILHEEQAVVETKAEPVERVRLTTEEYVEEETVQGTVRKERIEAEGIDEDTGPGR